MKSPAMSPPRKYLNPNQYVNILSTGKYQSHLPQLAKFPPGFKLLINKSKDDPNDSTDTLRNYK